VPSIDPQDQRLAELASLLEKASARIEVLDKRVDELAAENRKLKAENKKLRAQLGQNSTNSSKPPSSDPPWKKPKPKGKKGKRKRGGQPGHKKHTRELVPIEESDEVVVVKPESCSCCGGPLHGDDPSPHRHQVVELPQVVPLVTEYQQHSLGCDACGAVTTEPLPEGVPTRAFGPSVDATVSLLTGVYRLSKRMVCSLMADLYSLPISTGSVVACERSASEALAAPVDEAHAFAQQQELKFADETSWREDGKKIWLWTVVTQLVTVFVLHARRNTDAAKQLLGKAVGILHTDRHGAYNWWPTVLRQLCWAHLTRDLRAISERGGESERIGNALLDEEKRMFHWWHRVRDGTLARSTFIVYMRPLRKRVEELLTEGAALLPEKGSPPSEDPDDSELKTGRTCGKILKHKEALWTFVRVEGVEPTNNTAEQAVRYAVLWRNICFGTQSSGGSRFVERILTVHATLRQQKRNVLAFIRQACEASLHRQPPPSLLPERKD